MASIRFLNMTMEAVFRHIEDSAKGTESEDDFAGLFVNDGGRSGASREFRISSTIEIHEVRVAEFLAQPFGIENPPSIGFAEHGLNRHHLVEAGEP